MGDLNSFTCLNAIFDELDRRLTDLYDRPSRDNEAARHDRLILPILTHPLLLGWDHVDLIAQANVPVPRAVAKSHIFRDSVPRNRRPDILVAPFLPEFNALVVEEKARQASVHYLNDHRLQLHEYQALYECVWGLLTDGERWIVKRGFETFHTFDSLNELRRGLYDLRSSIGKESIIERKIKYGTADLVYLVTADVSRDIMPPPGLIIPYRHLNRQVWSCKEAAQGRVVELHRVLKTLILETPAGLFAVHLPGDRLLSLRKVKQHLRTEARFAPYDRIEALGMGHGTISAVLNPVWSMPHLVSERVFESSEVTTNNGTPSGYYSFSPEVFRSARHISVGDFENLDG